jgi:HD-GYP domain-containing protein (c-di-GMP phosphodiesterase class II)
MVELGWKRRVSREDLQSAVAVVLSVSWFGVALKREAQRLRAFEGTIKAVVAAVDAKDTETRGHSDRVALLSRALGEALDLAPEFLEELYFGALLHDVGKIGIPDAILQKPDKLCYEEFEAIKEHPLLGKGIMEAVELSEVAVQGILEHHERLDGTGYPRGLKGEEVSLRIFAYFREERGTRYDPKVVDALLSIGEDWYAARELPESPPGDLPEEKV